MTARSAVTLGELIAPRLGSVDPSKHRDEYFDLYSIPAFDNGDPDVVQGAEIGSAKQLVAPGDVLLSRIVPHIRRAWVVGSYRGRRLVASGEWIVFRSDRFDARFLRHVLVSDAFHAEFMRTVSGVGGSLLRARPSHVVKIRVPFPPLAEQRRIAEILDKADALRAKRLVTLAQLDTLTQSIFLGIFGDPVTNPKHWPVRPLLRLLAAPLRNGLSPSKGGRITAKVLTLSAITGNSFDPGSLKTSTFHATPPLEQSVHEEDLLICRGNGNLNLVGKGYFPCHRMPDVTFPDTMIAARIERELIDPLFLEHVWNSPLVRRQIESAARTTNGTLKVNQSMLEAILVLSPPLRIQREFAVRISEVNNVKNKQHRAASVTDALFASLQHRAFRGEL